jgi:hypothetical protein
MALGFTDPFDALFRFQRALDQQLDSDWLEDATSGVGAFPPIKCFGRAATSWSSSRCRVSARMISVWR